MVQQTYQERPINTGKLIHMLSHQLKRHNSESEESSDLTHIQRHILNYVLFESLGRDVYQKDLEEAFHIRKSTVTGILQLMEKNGFIKRESVEKDRPDFQSGKAAGEDHGKHPGDRTAAGDGDFQTGPGNL